MLQSIGEIDQDPHFKASNSSAVNMSNTLRETVVVSSPTGKVPLDCYERTHYHKLSDALTYCSYRQLKSPVALKFSIHVYEGTYFNCLYEGKDHAIGLTCITSLKKLTDLSIEIIGIGDVRFVFLGDFTAGFIAVHTSIRNIRIYNRNMKPDAAISAKVSVTNCYFGHIRGVTAIMATRGAEVTAIGCTFNDTDEAQIQTFAKGLFQDCHFRGNFLKGDRDRFWQLLMEEKGFKENFSSGLFAGVGSSLIVRNCTFEDLCYAIGMKQHETKADIQGCKISNSCSIALHMQMNCEATFDSNEIDSDAAIFMQRVVEGSIELKSNKSTKGKIIILKDILSCKPSHDFPPDGLKIIKNESPCFANHGHSRKDRSEHSKDLKSKKKAGNFDHRLLETDTKLKQCSRCQKIESEGPFRQDWYVNAKGQKVPEDQVYQKFKYCQNCKQSVYCSDDCQKSD